MANHVRSGDTVVITAGAHKGKTGEVTTVIPKHDQVIVKGINMRTRNIRPTKLSPQGGVKTKEAPIHISNVSPAVQVDGQWRATRVRFETREDGSKVRIAVKTGKELGSVRDRKSVV